LQDAFVSRARMPSPPAPRSACKQGSPSLLEQNVVSIRILALCLIAVFSSATAAAESPGNHAQVIDCAHPPSAVIRVWVLGGVPSAELYEWTGPEFRHVGTVPRDQTFDQQFPEGSIYHWDRWGANAPGISRSAAGPGTILTTPYSVSANGRWLAAGWQALHETSYRPSRLALIDLSTSTPIRTIQLGGTINSITWHPSAEELLIVSDVERYGRRTLRERFASAIGHPIPYSDIKLFVVGLDGSVRCSVFAARNLAYASAIARWDAE